MTLSSRFLLCSQGSWRRISRSRYLAWRQGKEFPLMKRFAGRKIRLAYLLVSVDGRRITSIVRVDFRIDRVNPDGTADQQFHGMADVLLQQACSPVDRMYKEQELGLPTIGPVHPEIMSKFRRTYCWTPSKAELEQLRELLAGPRNRLATPTDASSGSSRPRTS